MLYLHHILISRLSPFPLRWPFFISPMDSFQRGMQIVKKLVWRAVRRFPRFLNVGTHIVHIHTVLEGFAYPCETGYADFVKFYGTAHLNWSRFKGNITFSPQYGTAIKSHEAMFNLLFLTWLFLQTAIWYVCRKSIKEYIDLLLNSAFYDSGVNNISN